MLRPMIRQTMFLAALLAAGCADKSGNAASASSAPSATAAVTATASATPSATAPASATTSAPAPTDEAAPAPSDSADAPPAKKYDCGAKRQKPCPMQGWMKKVMARAAASGDGAKLAEALEHVAKKPPPGYAEWTAMAKEGAAKAKAGDIDGAKVSCKKCHDAYKRDYKDKMRDKPW